MKGMRSRIFFNIPVEYARGVFSGLLEFKVSDYKAFLDSALECDALSVDGLKRYIKEKENG